MENKIYYLGIDGGGTKTLFVLSDEKKNILKSLKRECCNPMDIGIEKTKKVLKEGICNICEGISARNVVLYAGIAGGTSGNMKTQIEAFLSTFGFKAYENSSDIQNIVAAGLQEEDGITVIMGTGSCAIAQKDGLQKRISGWGYLFDDGGSAYNVGRDALAEHFRFLDGYGKYSMFSDYVSQTYPNAQQLLGLLYEGGKRAIASFAEKVCECADAGDQTASDIIKRNMKYVADIIKVAGSDMDTNCIKVVLAGGLTKSDMAIRFLKEMLENDGQYQLQVLKEEPAEGALVLAEMLWERVKENGYAYDRIT